MGTKVSFFNLLHFSIFLGESFLQTSYTEHRSAFSSYVSHTEVCGYEIETVQMGTP